MTELTTLSVRMAALLGSAAVHAGFAVALTGHVPAPTTRSWSAVEMEIATLVEPAAPSLDPAPSAAAKPRATSGTPHTHRHTYPVPPSHDAAEHDPSLVHLPLFAPAETAPNSAANTASEAVPRFVIKLDAAQAQLPTGASGGQQVARAGAAAGEPVLESAVDTPARLLSGSAPAYPREARALGIEADVPLEIIVDGAGHVTHARLLRAAGYGLDDAALSGVRAYHFAPARRAGRATPVRMQWTVQFRLQ